MDTDQNPGLPVARDEASLAYAPTEHPNEGQQGFSPRRMLSAWWRYKWLTLGLLVVGAVVGFAVRHSTGREYLAEARLWMQAPDGRALGQGPLQSEGLLQDRAWLELLRSWSVLDYVVREERLYLEHQPADHDVLDSLQLDSLFRAGSYVLKVGQGGRMELRSREGVLIEEVTVGDSVGRDLGYRWAPPTSALRPAREIAFTIRPPRDAAKILNDRLQVALVPPGNFMTLEYSHSDPARAASVVNAVANRFIDVAAELKKRKLTVLTQILENQLASADSGLRAASMALEGYRVETITLPSEGSTPVAPGLASTQQSALSNFFDLKILREQLDRDRKAILRVIAGTGDSLSVDALITIVAVQQATELSQALQALALKRSELRSLRHEYQDAHRLVREAVAQEDTLQSRVVPTLARRLADELYTRVQTLDAQIASAGEELKDIPPRATDEAGLRRQFAAAEILYNNLLQRYEEARLATETTVPDVSILDEAKEPQAPAADNRMRLLLMILAGTFAAALALPILMDRLDPRLRYPEQVTAGLRLPILGAVPMMRHRGGRRQDAPQVVEALRTLRLSIVHAHGSAGPVMLTVTSPGSGDGKTFVASNLALAFSDLGLRTLLIDGDIRRGQLHKLLNVEGKPGLTDFLSGSAELPDVIRRSSIPRVDLLPRGTLFAHGPELLSSPRMGDLVRSIRTTYQAVIVDSPPLGAGVDPLVLGSLTGNLLLVVRTGKTERAFAEAKLTEIDRLPIRVLGAVMNGIESGGVYKYYSYLPNYTAYDEAVIEEDVAQPA